MLESKFHSETCFITLTYNDENLPFNNSLSKRHAQLFIKRLRKKVAPLKIRYFLAGEYGGRKGRAHYHLVLFGYVPKDLVYLKNTSKDEVIYTSKELASVWGKGFVSIGLNMTLNSLKYVAKYLAKLSNFDPIKQDPPFSTQSNRPGIGALAFDTSIYETDGIYLDGKKWAVPRYFDKLAERQGFDLDPIKIERDLKVKAYGNTFPSLREKWEYKNWVERQGYNLNHLFTPSAKIQLRDFTTFDFDGVLMRKAFEKDLASYYKFHIDNFLNIYVEENPFMRTRQMSLYDLDKKLLRYVKLI